MIIKKVVLVLLASVLLFYQAELANSQLSNPSQNKSKSTADTSQQNSTQKIPNTFKKDAKADSTQKPKVKVTAYYFHRTHRCRTCLTIEKYAQQALEHYFKKELTEGKLEFKPMDMEKAENRHYVKDYQLYTSSLILSLRKKDKEVKWENLEQVWFLVKDMEKFFLYVKDKAKPYLQEK